MAVGVIFDSQVPPDGANFLVPTESLARQRIARNLKISSSCVYVEDREETNEETIARVAQLAREFLEFRGSFIVSFSDPQLSSLNDFISSLDKLDVSVLLSIPAMEDVTYWLKLRDTKWTKNVRFVLRFTENIPEQMAKRYKVLNYLAILVEDTDDLPIIAELVTKREKPSVMVHQGKLKRVLDDLKRTCAAVQIEPHLDKLIDPLQPLTQQMDLDVYQTFERDTEKYSSYGAAIRQAMGLLRDLHDRMRVLVVGPGRGFLLLTILSVTRPEDKITVVEKNPKCMRILERLCAGHKNVKLVNGDVRNLKRTKFHLCVSELLGSFGCNEAALEILANISAEITIPDRFASYLQPVYTDIFLRQLADVNMDRPYLAKLNSYMEIGSENRAFSFDSPCSPLNVSTSFVLQHKHYDNEEDPRDVANALLGYFEAILYEDIKISICPNREKGDSESFCNSWYPMLFPIGDVKFETEITMERHSTDKLWYEWKVGDKVFNAGGRSWSVSLDNDGEMFSDWSEDGENWSDHDNWSENEHP